MTDTIRIPKSSATHADSLLAIGLADLLGDLFTPQAIRMRDEGHCVAVEAPDPVDPAIVDRLPLSTGFRYIHTDPKDKVPSEYPICDYVKERERAERYRARALDLRKAGQTTAAITELLKEDRPSRQWARERAVRLLQGHHTANKLIIQVLARGLTRWREDVKDGLGRFRNGDPSGLPADMEQVQVFNPPAAKGYARLKPDGTDRNDKTSDQWKDPLAEWLRARGFHRVAAPFLTGSKGEHIRVIVPVPGDISLAALSTVSDELQGLVRSGSEPKIDCLAAIALAALLVERSEECASVDGAAIGPPILRLAGARVNRIIPAIHVTHYQSMGSAKAVASMAQVALPGWFGIASGQDAEDWLHILAEHRAAILSLDGRRSDEIGILVGYRRFLQSQDVQPASQVAEAFLDFLGQYGCFLVRARERQRRVRQFATRSVRRVLEGMEGMSGPYTTILDDPGFTAVADAVRRSTVSAQYFKKLSKSGGSDRPREVRYDLLPELRRKRLLTDAEFLESVAAFISEYNTENARRRELDLRAPRNVTTEEFHAFAALVETHHASTVGALLVAYGSCRSPRDPDTSEPEPEAEVASEADDASH